MPIVQVGTRDWELAKNYPAEIAMDADVKETLAALLPVLQDRRSAAQPDAARARTTRIAENNWNTNRTALIAKTEPMASQKPIRAELLMMRIAEVLPENGVIVEEGLTSSRSLLSFLQVKDPQRFFGLASGGIGFGIAGAVGIKLALPERPVVAVIGDGSSMYSIQALWTAAHFKLPMVFVIANNGAYSILKERLVAFGGSSVTKETLIGMDFDPAINFPQLAESLGVTARRVESPGDIKDALGWALSQNGPVLLDVTVHDGFRN